MRSVIITVVLFLALAVTPKAYAVGSWAHTQTGVGNGSSTGTSIPCTLGTNPVIGHVSTVHAFYYAVANVTTTATAQDGAGKVYTMVASPGFLAATGQVFGGYLIVPSGADKVVTVTFGASFTGGFGFCYLDEWTPTGGTAAFDNTASQASGTGVINTPSIPVSGAGGLVTAIVADADMTGAVTGGWSLSNYGDNTGFNMEWQLNVSSATAVGFAGSGANVYTSVGMSFKIIAAASTTKGLTMRGIGD